MAEGRIVSTLAAVAAVVVSAAVMVSLDTARRDRAEPRPSPSSAPVTPGPGTSAALPAPAWRGADVPVPSAGPGAKPVDRPTSTTPIPAPTPTPRTAPTTPSSPSSRAPAPSGGRLPLSYPTGTATQVITVVARGTTATVQRWAKAGSGWVKVGAAMFGYVGAQGVTTNAREGYAGTPAGSWTLTQAFGRYAAPAGNRLPYFKTDSLDWWDGDSASPTYSTHQRCAQSACPFRVTESENLYGVGQPYNYAVVIDYNTPNSPTGAIPGKGSAFFLHVANGMPTAGCVSVSQANMTLILAWLNPAQHPRILIGT